MATLFVLKLFIVKRKNVSKQLHQIYSLLERIDSTFQDIRLLNEELILEAASLSDVYQKYYSNIPEEEFKQIVAADPTAGEDKMGKYSKWLLALYTNGNLPLEDLYKANEYLTTFHKYKGKLEKKDIGQYKSLPDLYDAIEPYSDNTQAASHKEEIRQIKQDAEKVYEDKTWLVIVPHTKEAAIEYGKGTQWCTAATGSYNYFDDYNEEGPLYININKKTGKKYQFHFESGQFMNEQDRPISISKMPKALKNFYYQKYGLKALYDSVKPIGEEWEDEKEEKLYLVQKGRKFNIITEDNNVICDTWYDDINGFKPFCENIAKVLLNYKVNFINRQGQLFFDEWFDWAGMFGNGPCMVQNNDRGYNFVTTDGKLLSDFYFASAENFRNGWARVTLRDGSKNKYNLINDKGEFIAETWPDYITNVYYTTGLARITQGQKDNFITGEGNLISNEWFADCDIFVNVLGSSQLCLVTREDGTKNLINTRGKLFFNEWYQDIYILQNHGIVILGQDAKRAMYDIIYSEMLLDGWYDNIILDGDYVKIEKDGKFTLYNLRTRQWQFQDIWADNFEFLSFHKNDENYLITDMYALAKIYNNGKMNIITKEGDLLSEIWFDKICGFIYTKNAILVENDGKYNYIDLDTHKPVFDAWKDDWRPY